MDTTRLSFVKNIKVDNVNKIFVGVLIAAVVLGGLAGYLLSASNKRVALTPTGNNGNSGKPATSAGADNQTFRDFADGTIQKRPAPKNSDEYVEGTHLLVRVNAVPVALTSSVVDLSAYEGKKVKVFGETQKAIKEGWLMDVGKVEVQ
jgi:hypothetical protein